MVDQAPSAPDSTKAPSTGPEQSPTSDADRVRTTAQWMVASFGAVAAALLASLKLSDIGKFDSTAHAWALAGFGLGMLGVAVAIVAMAWVMEPNVTTLKSIEDDDHLKGAAEREDWLSGFDSVKDLTDYYDKAAKDRIDTYQRMTNAAGHSKQDDFDAATAEHDIACRELQLVNPAVDRVLTYANSFTIVRKWHRALGAFVVGIVLASVGVGIFASQTSSSATTPAVAASPTRVTVDLTSAATNTYQERLGKACDANAIEAIALSESHDTTDLLVTDAKCAPIELGLTPKEADIRAPALPVPGTPPASNQKSN